MPPPFGPYAGAGRPRGPPPFVVQILRAPLTLNNVIALSITMAVRRSLKAQAIEAGRTPCMMTSESAFSFLALVFAMSIGHNILSVMRFHRIRREVFGESMCAARRRWKQRGEIALDEEEIKARREKFQEMGKRMPSILISTTDLFLAMSFLGLFIWTTLLAQKWGKVELTVAYSSIGALVACVFNLIIGLNGVKFWVRQNKKQQGARLEEATNEHVADVKEKLLEN